MSVLQLPVTMQDVVYMHTSRTACHCAMTGVYASVSTSRLEVMPEPIGTSKLPKACSNSTPPVLPLAESHAVMASCSCVHDERQQLEGTKQGVT